MIGCWYVIDLEGNLATFSSESDADNYCADLGIVWSSGYAKHMRPGWEWE